MNSLVAAPEDIAAPLPLCGRASELERIDRLLAGARAGRSGALVLRGVAGAGKTALLEAARARCRQGIPAPGGGPSAAGDMCVLASGGVESEAELPYAALHQLLRPVLDRVDGLADVQAHALRGALGLTADGGEQRFLVSVAVLSLLADVAEERPLLCLVDDAHWLDAASAEALAFVARRLQAERIAVLFATRETGLPGTGLPELAVEGLPEEAAARLLDRRAGGLAPEVRQRLVESTGGNPLALLELSGALTADQRAGAEPLVGPLPVSTRVERAFLTRVERLSGATRTLLLVAATDDSGELATVLAAADALGARPAALDAAERTGLASVRAGRIELRHPLLRSAVYHGATASQRRAAHAALAGVLSGTRGLMASRDSLTAHDTQADRRAWHRAAASVEPDPTVVGELEQAAERARRRGGYAAAALALERAAMLTPENEQRARQLARAGECAWLAGRTDRAVALLERARGLAADPSLRADADRLRSVIGLNCGLPGDAGRLALRAAEEIAPLDARRALHLLNVAGFAATYAGDGDVIAAIGALAARVTIDDTPLAQLLEHQLHGIGAYCSGDFAAAAPHLRRALELAGDAEADGSAELTEVLSIAAAGGLFLGDDRAVRELHRRMVARARDNGALGLLTWALPRLAVSDIWAGQWSSASAALGEALDLARAVGQHVVVAYVLSEQAIVAALRGEEEACRALAAEAQALAADRRLEYVRLIAEAALVALDLALGRAPEALRRSATPAPLPGLDFWDALDRIEAAVRAGEPDAAREALDVFEPWAATSGSPWGQAVALHGRALLADEPAEAERLFAAALERYVGAGRPFERARTELALGEHLRRARRRKEARAHLRAALEGFDALGARLWAERARTELRASGQTARRRDPSTLDELTPQELQIAHRVAEGGTNRDIAAQLFLSPRTIDFHLRNIFRKLGISSRMELARLDLNAAGAR